MSVSWGEACGSSMRSDGVLTAQLFPYGSGTAALADCLLRARITVAYRVPREVQLDEVSLMKEEGQEWPVCGLCCLVVPPPPGALLSARLRTARVSV